MSVLWWKVYCYGLCQFYGEQYTVMDCVCSMENIILLWTVSILWRTVYCYELCQLYGNSMLLWTVSVLWEQYTAMDCVCSMGTVYCYELCQFYGGQYTVMDCVCSMGDSILLWTVSSMGSVYCYGLCLFKGLSFLFEIWVLIFFICVSVFSRFYVWLKHLQHISCTQSLNHMSVFVTFIKFIIYDLFFWSNFNKQTKFVVM